MDLVAIPSVNPCFSDGTGEKEITEFISTYARRSGLETHRMPVDDERENVLIGIEGQSDEIVLWETHMDTVTAEGMAIPPFEPQVKDGKIFGRGACDAKASLAAMLQALVEVAKKGPPQRTIWLAAVVDEENGFKGVQKLVSSGFKADYAIVGEPTELNIAIAHKGTVRGSIFTYGVSAHTSHPEKGVNAIMKMAKVIQALERYDSELRMQVYPLVGNPTLTVTFIQGGRGLNLVPDFCQIKVDRRTLPNEDPLTAWNELIWFIKNQPEFVEFNVEVGEPELVNWGMEVPEDSPQVKRFYATCQQVGLKTQIIGVRYTSDASFLTRNGIPAMLFGPGSIEQAHTADEWVAIDQVVAAQKVFEALATMPLV
ncbi:MAG: M20 family metallopeptidase [Candidatus Fervidibacter sp.]|uniref:M20 family metallopeptidase n=1 Tax=Candidatus Fervidibacter sp. TaxID=3100871 RepID=UPI004049B7F8